MLLNVQKTILVVISGIYLMGFVSPVTRTSQKGRQCLTPNNETAVCIPVTQCQVITQAITTRNRTAIDFARKSQCGYEHIALVCCGSYGFPKPVVTRTTINKVSIKPFIHNTLPHSSVCGIERSDHRIYGGQATDLDEFPWASLLRYENEIGQDAGFKCGGSLINHKYVLTAAHCVTFLFSLTLTSVRFGEWRLSTNTDCVGEGRFRECSSPPVDVDVESTLPHPQYNKRLHLNDIALVRLKWNVKYTDFIRPICIPPPNTPSPDAGTKVLTVGWGATEKADSSDIKLKVQVSIVSKQQCSEKMYQRTEITDRHLCAGGTKNKDSCQGDSGGPLMIMVENEALSQPQWFQIGITSWGIGCGIEGFPGVYTRISAFSIWIVNNMVFDNN